MKIIFQIENLGSGGAEKQILLTARQLQGMGHQCKILTFNGGVGTARSGRLIAAAQAAGVVIVAKEGRRGGFLLGALRLVWDVVRLEKGVVWCWGRRSEIAGFLACCWRPKIMMLSSVRGSDEGRYRRHARVLRLVSRRVDLYVGNSRRGAEVLNQIVPGILGRFRIIRNALEDQEQSPIPITLPCKIESLNVVMLGNIRLSTKGYDFVITLAKELWRQRLPVRISIAGIDLAGGWLQREIAVNGLSEVLHYSGPTDTPREFLSSGNVFLLMSRHEGLPNALIEAMSIGLPCIASDVGDVRAFASAGHVVRIVPIGGVQEVIGILKEFLTDWGRACTLGAEAFQFAKEQFSEAALKSALKALLGEVEVGIGGSRQN